MALFGRKKEKEAKKRRSEEARASVKAPVKKAVKKAKKVSTPTSTANLNRDLTSILKKPRITEKGAIIAEEGNVYTFDIKTDATKSDVKAAIEKIYKVVPMKVRIAKVPSKSVRIRGERGKRGLKSGGKKAFVYLKKGEKIEFV